MELAFVIYFIDTWSGNPFSVSWKGYFAIMVFLAVILFVVSAFMSDMYEGYTFEDVLKRVWGVTKCPFYVVTMIVAIGSFLNMIIPSKETGYKMLAAYAVTEVATNDRV